MNMITPQKIQEKIHSSLAELIYIEAAWLSGSAAFQRTDKYSDIDIRALAASKHHTEIFKVVEAALKELSNISGIHAVNQHAVMGYRQCFYKLENASPFHLIDFVIIEEKAIHAFLELHRNGTPIIMFDRHQKIKTHINNAELQSTFQERIPQIKSEFSLIARVLVERAILRNRFAEAVHFYHTRVLNPLIEMLRAKYSPFRQDFGVRYMNWDFPDNIREQIDDLYAISNFQDLWVNLDKAEKLFWETTITHQK